MHLLHLLLHRRELRERARQLRVRLGGGKGGQRPGIFVISELHIIVMSYSFFPPGERSRRVCERAAVLEEGLGGAVEAAQLVVQLLHYLGLLLEPAIIERLIF